MKYITSIIIVSMVIVGGFFLHNAKNANAQIPVTDVANVGLNTWSNIAESILQPIVQVTADAVIKKMTGSVVNWANGGFDGEPGFINNWDDFLKGTEHAVIAGAFKSASLQAELAQQNDGIVGDLGDIAQENYNLYQSGEIQTTRAVAETIARFGVQQLNNDPLESIINGKGETLSTLLGSQQAKEQFKSDLSVGGWEGYLALADPHNYDVGLQGIVQGALQNKSNTAVTNSIAEVQTPTTLLSKRKCTEYKKDAQGNRTDECAREVVETPGDVIASQLNTSLGIEQQEALNLSGTLINSLVKGFGDLVSGLTNGGLNQLGDAAAGAFFNADSINDFIQGDFGTNGGYQSQYDVLGIQSDSGFINTTNPTGSSGGNNGGGTNSTNLFIGGPEDDDGTFNGGPQITVNFQETLESDINLTQQELLYYEQIRTSIANASDVLFEFDKCIPGPDYGWEERYRDVLNVNGNDEDNQINAIGLNETKSMFSDPNVNIPGGSLMANQLDIIFDTVTSTSLENSFRIEDLRRNVLTLGFIKEGILSEFNNQKVQISTDLVLFREDWELLSQGQRQGLLNEAIERGFYINPQFVNENSINQLPAVSNDPDAVRNAVLSMAWNLWRTQTDPAIKLELRQSYYSLQNDLSNQQLITLAKTKANQVSQTVNQSYGSALDCMVFKSYAVGTDRATISAIVNNTATNTDDKIFALAEFIDQYDPAYSSPPFGNVLRFYKNDTVRNDGQLRTFLESEYALQNSGNITTVLKTPTMTAPSSIANSILGFDSEIEKQEYFDSFYPDNEFPYPENRNKLSIKEMYRVDRAYAKTNRAGPAGSRGHLFCRNSGEFEVINSSGGGDTRGTNCWKDFYSASKLDYQLIISGINN